MVVVEPPVFEDHTALAQRVEQLPVQAFLPEPPVESLRMPVLRSATFTFVYSWAQWTPKWTPIAYGLVVSDYFESTLV